MHVRFAGRHRNDAYFEDLNGADKDEIKSGVIIGMAAVEQVVGGHIALPERVNVAFTPLSSSLAYVDRNNLHLNIRRLHGSITYDPGYFNGILGHETSHLSENVVRPYSQYYRRISSKVIREGKGVHLGLLVAGDKYTKQHVEPLTDEQRANVHKFAISPGHTIRSTVRGLAETVGIGVTPSPLVELGPYKIGNSVVGDVIAQTGVDTVLAIHAEPVRFYVQAARDYYQANPPITNKRI